MARNIHGGGSKTNINGLGFEQETKLETALNSVQGIEIRNNTVYRNATIIGLIANKHDFIRIILSHFNVHWYEHISKKLLPDDALFLNTTNTVYIIEKKFQNTAGSVDEKLQTCDFKLKQYKKLFSNVHVNVKYIYILNDFFKQSKYYDVLNYIEDSNCQYFFNSIPLDIFGF